MTRKLLLSPIPDRDQCATHRERIWRSDLITFRNLSSKKRSGKTTSSTYNHSLDSIRPCTIKRSLGIVSLATFRATRRGGACGATASNDYTFQTCLLELPPEIIIKICGYLEDLQDFLSLNMVAKEMKYYSFCAFQKKNSMDFSSFPSVSAKQFSTFVTRLTTKSDGSPLLLSAVRAINLSGCRKLTRDVIALLTRACSGLVSIRIDGTLVKANETKEILFQSHPAMIFGQWTKLHDSVTYNQWISGNIKYLEEDPSIQGIFVDVADSKGITPFLAACYVGSRNAVEFLSRHGAMVDSSDCYGVTGLMKASYLGHKDVFNFLVHDLGASVSTVDMYGAQALAKAAFAGHEFAVKGLIEAGADIEARDCFGNTPLMAAATGGRSKIVKILLKAGASPDAKDKKGETACTRAKKRKYDDIVIILNHHGANLEEELL